MRRFMVALAVSLVLVGCSAGPEFADHVAARRAAFSPNGPFLDLLYLTCRGEAIPDVRAVQTDGPEDLEWEVLRDNYFGSPRINGTVYFTITRNHGPARAQEADLPVERESHLDVEIFVEGEDPLVVSGLKIGDLREDAYTLATGEEVEDIDVQEWESEESTFEQARGCDPG